MHELALGNSIIKQALEQLKQNDVELLRVTKLRLSVGDLSGADARTLGLIMNDIMPSSELPNAVVEIENVPAFVDCEQCGDVEAMVPFRLLCPKCGARPLSVKGGEDITIDSVEVDDGQ